MVPGTTLVTLAMLVHRCNTERRANDQNNTYRLRNPILWRNTCATLENMKHHCNPELCADGQKRLLYDCYASAWAKPIKKSKKQMTLAKNVQRLRNTDPCAISTIALTQVATGSTGRQDGGRVVDFQIRIWDESGQQVSRS